MPNPGLMVSANFPPRCPGVRLRTAMTEVRQGKPGAHDYVLELARKDVDSTISPECAFMDPLIDRYKTIRRHSMTLVAGLSAEDCMLQSMPEASPVKWHLAHTTWFFETFVLETGELDFRAFAPAFRVLFNSYYVGVGERHPRPQRGLLSRPGMEEVLAYRQNVDERMRALLVGRLDPALEGLIELGLQHEQQHQELILTDLLHHFSCNPLKPAYRPAVAAAKAESALEYRSFEGGVAEIGHAGQGFAFDNETPRHRVLLEPFSIAQRPVSQGEFLRFVLDHGYQRPELWLSEGWDLREREGWTQPLYWHAPKAGLDWQVFGLAGLQTFDPAAPVAQLSFFEADAFARWSAARLPTEAEWEHAAQRSLLAQTGRVWEWTASAYLPYPGFAPAPGAVGEYNGKFMINQMVLRGGSLATPAGHARTTYRNFFPAAARWQFSGLRLARNP